MQRFKLLSIVLSFSFVFILFNACSSSKPEFKADYDVIVIGGGLGGLSATAHCASKGLKVLLLEQHFKVGGCATDFKRGKYTFDVSLHEMAGAAEGSGLSRLMKSCGVYDRIKLIQLDHLYRSIVPGSDVSVGTSWDGYTGALKKVFPGEAEGIDQFREICSSVGSQAMELSFMFRGSKLRNFFTILMVPFRQNALFTWRNKTVKDLMDECFKSDKLKAHVSQLWCYLGPPNDELSALFFMAAINSYITDGAWHIRGTSQALANAYAERIHELGGKVKTSTLVTKIIMRDGLARGVRTDDGKEFSSRYVIANTDPYQLTEKLIGREHIPESYLDKLKDKKKANSLFGVWLGLNIDLKKRGYTDYEIFYNSSVNSRENYKHMMKGDYKNGSVVIAIYSNLGDPVYAPPGSSVVKLDAYADISTWPKDDKEYEKKKKKKMEELISLAAKAIPELADSRYVDVKVGYTPRTLERFTLNRGGVVYGFNMTVDQFGKIPVSTPIDNIFIASNWTKVSHGFGGSQRNGWMAARLIMDREGIE